MVFHTHKLLKFTRHCVFKSWRIPDGRGIAKKHLPGCIHHASMGQYRPLGGDDQWRRHIAPGTMAWLSSPESSDQCHNVILSEPRQTGPVCQVKNLRWLLTSMLNPEEDQSISSWNGFSILISAMTSLWCRILWATCQ